MTEAFKGSYPDWISDIFERHRPKAPFNPNKILLDRGKKYPMVVPHLKKGLPRRCFNNSIERMDERAKDPSRYVEGYIDVHGVSLHHAWNVLDSNPERAVDSTLGPMAHITNYFGVIVPTEVMLYVIQHKKWVIGEGVLGTLTMMHDEDLQEVKKLWKL